MTDQINDTKICAYTISSRHMNDVKIEISDDGEIWIRQDDSHSIIICKAAVHTICDVLKKLAGELENE